MASENETVADIVREMRNDAIAADAWHETYGEMASAASTLNRHADRVEAAHRRYERISESLSLAKKRIEAEIADKSKVIQELNDVRELNRKCCDENERLNGEVAELRECLKEAVELMDGKPTSRGIARWRKALKGAKYE